MTVTAYNRFLQASSFEDPQQEERDGEETTKISKWAAGVPPARAAISRSCRTGDQKHTICFADAPLSL